MHQPCPSSAAAAICTKFRCRNTKTCICLTHLLARAPCITRFTKLLSFSGTTIHQRSHTWSCSYRRASWHFQRWRFQTPQATKLTVCLSDCPIAKFASTESGRSLNLTPTSPVKCTSIQCTKLRIPIRASSLQKLGNSSTHASTQGFYPALLLERTEFHTPPFPISPPQCSSPTVALRPPNTPSLTWIHHSTLSLHSN